MLVVFLSCKKCNVPVSMNLNKMRYQAVYRIISLCPETEKALYICINADYGPCKILLYSIFNFFSFSRSLDSIYEQYYSIEIRIVDKLIDIGISDFPLSGILILYKHRKNTDIKVLLVCLSYHTLSKRTLILFVTCSANFAGTFSSVTAKHPTSLSA